MGLHYWTRGAHCKVFFVDARLAIEATCFWDHQNALQGPGCDPGTWGFFSFFPSLSGALGGVQVPGYVSRCRELEAYLDIRTGATTAVGAPPGRGAGRLRGAVLATGTRRPQAGAAEAAAVAGGVALASGGVGSNPGSPRRGPATAVAAAAARSARPPWSGPSPSRGLYGTLGGSRRGTSVASRGGGRREGSVVVEAGGATEGDRGGAAAAGALRAAQRRLLGRLGALVALVLAAWAAATQLLALHGAHRWPERYKYAFPPHHHPGCARICATGTNGNQGVFFCAPLPFTLRLLVAGRTGSRGRPGAKRWCSFPGWTAVPLFLAMVRGYFCMLPSWGWLLPVWGVGVHLTGLLRCSLSQRFRNLRHGDLR